MSRQGVWRKNYRPPAFRVDSVALDVDIEDEGTTVVATLAIVRTEPDAPLHLDARQMTVESISIDGRALAEDEYERHADHLLLPAVPDRFSLRTRVRVEPERNTALEGLYRSGSMLCTQCEAHGFSRITPFPDRPDVLSKYQVRISADRARYPVLLSNGNRVAAADLDGDRHYAVWEDPYAKPCYLFALVAGDLACVEDRYRTASGREVRLAFYVDRGNEGRVAHAIAALKRAMRWDEACYGLEYDLDHYMVVAARDFNMGAMENKGLNLFNAAYVLASPDTATDEDYESIEAVIGHEYFHNWTGNRVTCRDWFQLSLKEGLTVLREQQFRESLRAAGVARIEQVETLRAQQFPEDAGPTAHPVRPEHYVEINNFYTPTVYEKGAEILRMIAKVQGIKCFVAGVREYLRRHDGQAATIEDFLLAQESVGERSLEGFRTWYSQAGTPRLRADDSFENGTYRLRLSQRTPPTPGQPIKRPVPIPVGFALYDPRGTPLALDGVPGMVDGSLILLETEHAELRVEGLAERPVPAFLHGYSAPVRLDYDYSPPQLALLAGAERDPFVRWQAVQSLMEAAHAELSAGAAGGGTQMLLETLQRLALRQPEDRELLAWMLRLPDLNVLADGPPQIDVDAFVGAYEGLRREIGGALCGPLSVWAQWRPEAQGRAGERALSSLALTYLCAQGTPTALDLARDRALESRNFTLVLGALDALNDTRSTQRLEALAACRERWRQDPLLLDRWFSLQARANAPDAVATLRALTEDPDFEWNNPNRVRAVLGAFAQRNWRGFHQPGAHAFFAEQLLRLDRINPQVASRLSKPLLRWRRFAEPWRDSMRRALETLASASLSPDLGEMVSRALDPHADLERA